MSSGESGEDVSELPEADKIITTISSSGGKDSTTTTSSTAQSVLLSGVFVSTFTMNFFAEWGDKSQISVILLAAKENWLLVLGGALIGHLMANTLAVLGGAFIRDIISIRTGNHPPFPPFSKFRSSTLSPSLFIPQTPGSNTDRGHYVHWICNHLRHHLTLLKPFVYSEGQ